MRRYLLAWFLSISISPYSQVSLVASEILLDDYRRGLSPKWEEKSLKGKTLYQVVLEDNEYCIKATSHSSASALYYKIEYDTRAYPILQWRWKVRRVFSKGNALIKEGDDYAARVYAVFPSTFFWETKVLTYIWANKLPIGKAVPNSHNANFMLIAQRSGAADTGKWMAERRNILEDYRRYFGQDPPKVGAIAIMTDTDNTGEEAMAWYGPIRIISSPGR